MKTGFDIFGILAVRPIGGQRVLHYMPKFDWTKLDIFVAFVLGRLT